MPNTNYPVAQRDGVASGNTSSPLGAASVWASIGSLIFGFIRLGAALVVTTSPVIIMCLGIAQPMRYFGFFLAMLFLSSPGIAASFAAFRDSPDLGYSPLRRAGEAEHAIAAGYIAAPRWRESEEHAIFIPYFRAFAQVLFKSLLVSSGALTVALILLYDRQWVLVAMPVAGQAFLVGALVALSVWFTALTMVVEMPKARWWAILRSSLFLSIRKWYLSLLNLFVLVGWLAGIIYAPVLMPVFGTPLLLHVIWANCRWIIMPMIKQLETEARSEL